MIRIARLTHVSYRRGADLLLYVSFTNLLPPAVTLPERYRVV